MKRIWLFWISFFFIISCNPVGNGHNPKKSQITVSILPQKYFVERIAGNKWEINVLIPPGHDPHVYEPTSLQMKKLSQSLIYFRIGHIVFEISWMGNLKNLNPKMKVVDTSEGIEWIQNESELKTGFQKHCESKKNRLQHITGIDPHVWLSPKAVKIISEHITKTLVELDPDNQAFYQENLQHFLLDIDQLDREIRQIMKNTKRKKFLVYHPAWSYFARDYGLLQIPIEVEGKSPNLSDLKKIIDMARNEGIRSIIVQKQFDTHSAEAIIKEINGQVIQLDPLALDWLNNLKKIAKQINLVLQ